MKRTTICRSSVSLAATILLGIVAAAPVAAQDSLQTSAARPATHTVQRGETLWGLAETYLGDALLWPEIYRLNTLVVEDPHWIFPGEVLRFGPPDTTKVTQAPQVAAAPESVAVAQPAESAAVAAPAESVAVQQPAESVAVPPPPPPPVQDNSPTVFSARPAPKPQASIVTGIAPSAFRAVRRGDFYASGFLTEGEPLPWARVVEVTNRGRVAGISASRGALMYETIHVQAPAGTTYHVGDSLLVANVTRKVPAWGDMVVPSGLVRVTYVSGRDVEAEVIAQYGRIIVGQSALPVAPYNTPAGVRPQPVEKGVTGHIVALKSDQLEPGQQAVVFIDLGRNDGVVPGDVFDAIVPQTGPGMADAPPHRIAEIHIVHVRDKSATGLLANIMSPGIGTGVAVRLVRKMPS
jgi:hypothetical protein